MAFGCGAVTAAVAGEAAALVTERRTLSQLFWTFSDTNPTAAWIILGCLAVGGILTLAHLAKRLVKKGGEGDL